MATAQSIDIKTEFTELSETAMEAFCRDITGMFDVEMVCKQQEGCTETVAGLKKRFKKITAVVTATAKGHLAGSFHLIFDQDGLFTLAGVIVMQPKQIIIENKRRGTLTEVENVRDAIKEGGNLLVGSWNRVCLEKWGSKTHLLQTDTFIGNPWTNSQESIHVAENEEFLYIPCEMTIADYPVFNYGILFPKAITDSILHPEIKESDPASKEQPKESPAVPEASVHEKPVPAEPAAAPVTAKPIEVKVEPAAAPVAAKPVEVKVEPVAAPVAAKPVEVKVEPVAAPVAAKPVEVKVEPAAAPVAAKPVEVKVEPTVAADSTAGPKTESVPATEKKVDLPSSESPVPTKLSATASSGSQEGPEILWTLCAKDIMRKTVIWCQSDESVEQVRIKMDQNDVGYVIAGTESMMEGIISRSDLAAALSPYLRPMFAQWRRPLDEASLQIKVKWIMSRPVQIVKPDKPLAIVMEKMCRHNVRALPVVDQHGKVEGLITVFDIFKTLLQKKEEVLFAVKTA